ncbi:MAG: NADH-quinone oxidoreductase subunit NuoK [Phycisphaeraceae bacterium]|nr:NADH-quinone oxidoreductase subunit NuoK [Phycisphaeraceae bacterium]
MPDIGLQSYMLVAAALFSLGLGVVVARKNAIALLCGLELILNGAALNFVALNRYTGPVDRMDGQMFAIFVIILAAAEAAIALAILLNLYQMTNSVNVDEADTLKN